MDIAEADAAADILADDGIAVRCRRCPRPTTPAT
jgi:hypothetical protein